MYINSAGYCYGKSDTNSNCNGIITDNLRGRFNKSHRFRCNFLCLESRRDPGKPGFCFSGVNDNLYSHGNERNMQQHSAGYGNCKSIANANSKRNPGDYL